MERLVVIQLSLEMQHLVRVVSSSNRSLAVANLSLELLTLAREIESRLDSNDDDE